jgi:ribosomal protein S18 acetylase RimI-like enzyme
MKTYLAVNFNPETIRSQIEDKYSIFLLGYEGSCLFGYAMLYKGSPPVSPSSTNSIELVRFYVLPDVIGAGYGSKLMQACLEEVTKKRFSTVWLGVWEKNKRAIHFYHKWGFQKVGEKDFLLGSDIQTDIVMQRSNAEAD